MRILHIITGLKFGGAEKLLYLTCKVLLLKYDVDINIVYFDPVSPIRPYLEELGVKCQQIDKSIKGFRQLYKLLKKESFDVIHTHLIHADILGRMAALLARNKKTIVFTTVHGTEWFRRESELFPKLVRIIDKLLSIPKKHHIIAISQSVRDVLIQNEKIHPNKITLLYNAVEIHNERSGQSSDRCSLLYVGRLSEEKNIPCLLKAIASLHQTTLSLSIVGAGPLEGFLREMVLSLKLTNQVHFKGTYFELTDIYTSHDILVLPSNNEGLGLVILEAFSFGLPVIGSNVDGIRELLSDGRGLLFEKGDSEDLAHKIKYLFDNRTELRKIGKVGLNMWRSTIILSTMLSD